MFDYNWPRNFRGNLFIYILANQKQELPITAMFSIQSEQDNDNSSHEPSGEMN